MHTSIVWLALAGLAAPADARSSPTWTSDYSQARRQGASQSKPLAVFLSPGKEGWEKLAKEGSLGGEAKRVLAERYVCVHIDTATEGGRKLARDFDLSGETGLVISDRTGQLQAFRHEGALEGADLKAYLERYGAPDRAVAATETHTVSRTSLYPSTPASVVVPSTSGVVYPPSGGTFSPGTFQGWSQPSYGYAPSFSRGGGGGGC